MQLTIHMVRRRINTGHGRRTAKGQGDSVQEGQLGVNCNRKADFENGKG